MKHHLRVLLAAVLILSLFAFAMSFAKTDALDSPLPMLRLVSGILVAGSLSLLIWAELRKDQVPEFLRRNYGKFFERSGFCFLPLQEIDENGKVGMWIYFQNRYSHPCEAVVHISPIRWRLRKPPLPALQVRITCPGAAYGRCGVSWPVPAGWEGKTILIGVGAESRYLSGKGELLRYREGVHVKGIRSGFWDAADLVTAVATGGMSQAMQSFGSDCRMKWTLPTRREGLPAGILAPPTEILWPA